MKKATNSSEILFFWPLSIQLPERPFLTEAFLLLPTPGISGVPFLHHKTSLGCIVYQHGGRQHGEAKSGHRLGCEVLGGRQRATLTSPVKFARL